MKFDDYKVHDSMRGWFGREMYFSMASNPNIFLLVGDLGYSMFDYIKSDFPDRFINTGAAEQCMMGAAIGLALSGKIPFVYSITPFLIYRPFEWIRNYLNHEKIPVRMVGSGNNDDYKHDGFTHHAFDIVDVMESFPNITSFYPKTKHDIPLIVQAMVTSHTPSFLCLRR